jgi:hypothetical protein
LTATAESAELDGVVLTQVFRSLGKGHHDLGVDTGSILHQKSLAGGRRAIVLRELVKEWNLEKEEACLIDDDVRELDGSSAYSETLLVEDATGIDPQIMMTLAEAAKNLSQDNSIELRGFGGGGQDPRDVPTEFRNRSGHSFEEL